MEKPIPEFAIFQNSRTQASGIWVKGVGKWKECSKTDYAPISVMAQMLRSSPNPTLTLQQIAQVIMELGDINPNDIEDGPRWSE